MKQKRGLKSEKREKKKKKRQQSYPVGGKGLFILQRLLRSSKNQL